MMLRDEHYRQIRDEVDRPEYRQRVRFTVGRLERRRGSR